MTDLFKRCMTIVLFSEGGFSNHPLDPGHATMKGITQSVYDHYRLKANLPLQSVAIMSDDEMYDIYWTLYWQPMNIEVLNDDDLILQVFDMGVNAGIRTSIKLLQRLVGTTDDGLLGKMTTDAVANYKGDILEDFIKRRKLFYVTLAQNKPMLKPFLKGWLNRVENTHF
jgi:lysozyme family protein